MITDVTITPGTATVVVTLAKAKKHLRVDASFTEEDDIIQDYIDASIVMAENFIGGHILDKNMVIKMTAFDNPLVFEAFPVKSVTSVSYFPEGSDEAQDLDAESYVLNSETPNRYKLRFKGDLPATATREDAVTVTINIGMSTATVPKPICQSVLLLVADMFERREDRTETITTTSAALLRPYKKY